VNWSPQALKIQAQAAAWLVRLEADDSAQVRAQWQQWASADSHHRAAYLRLEAGWLHAGCLKNLQPLDGTVDMDVLDTFPGLRTEPSVRVRSPAMYRTLTAGLAATTLILAAWLFISKPDSGIYRTGIGGFERVALPDGSTILLNTNSEIHVDLSARQRAIALIRGEAVFNVAHDARRPFDVRAGGTTVRAVGTSFAVRLQSPRQIEVLVAKGRVAVDPESATLPRPLLTAGADARIDAGNQPHVEQMDAEGVTHRLAWTQGQIWFEQQTLAAAIVEFNRYNRRQLVLSDPSLASLRIGGSFDATDPEAFVAALGRVFAIRAVAASPDEPAAEVIRLVGPAN
jgi:transmembrane sensor